MSEELTLEKLKVDERLKKVENHMVVGEENRKTLMIGFDKLEKSVNKIEETLFGEKGNKGLVHRIDSVLLVADGIKWVLNKILLAICSSIALQMMPTILAWLAKIIK